MSLLDFLKKRKLRNSNSEFEENRLKLLKEIVNIDYASFDRSTASTKNNASSSAETLKQKRDKVDEPKNKNDAGTTEQSDSPEQNSAQQKDESANEDWYELKGKLISSFFGEENSRCYFSIMPASVGGNHSMFYYPKSNNGGTTITTKQLSDVDGKGTRSLLLGRYELAIQTRHAMPESGDIPFDDSAFGKANKQLASVLQTVAKYATTTELEPFQTIESAEGPNWYGAILLGLQNRTAQHHDFGMMLIVQVHKSELAFARKHGTEKLIDLLEKYTMFPFSDLDRPPVA